MKTRSFLSILILVLAVLIIAGSCVTKRKAIADEDLSKAYTGTWINEEYENGKKAKIVLFADGTWERYYSIDSDNYYCQGENTILDKWKDSKGSIWFECRWECFSHRNSGYQLTRISDSGKTLELEYTTWDFPTELDTDNFYYRIYYRQ